MIKLVKNQLYNICNSKWLTKRRFISLWCDCFEIRSASPRRSAVLNYFADGTISNTDEDLLKGIKIPKVCLLYCRLLLTCQMIWLKHFLYLLHANAQTQTLTIQVLTLRRLFGQQIKYQICDTFLDMVC